MDNVTQEAELEAMAKCMYDELHRNLSNCYEWDQSWEDYQEAARPRYYTMAKAALKSNQAALATALAERTVDRAEIARLRGALRPFAALADEVEAVAAACNTTPANVAKVCTWKDLEAARTTLSGSQQ